MLLEPDAFRRIAYEYLEDAAGESVRHAEFFWNPTATIRDTALEYAEVQEAIVAGMAEAERDFGISALLIPSIDREAGARAAIEMVEAVIAHRHPAVAGIGIDYRETEFPPEIFIDAYRLAGEAGLHRTAHAGEFGTPWTNVHTALNGLCVDRVDHGYTIVDNPALVDDCIRRDILFTVVPTNSYYLRTLPSGRWALDHPIRQMQAAGLRLHPNTDDPTLHQVTPAGAWELMYSHLGFEIEDLRAMILNGIAGSWLSTEVREILSTRHAMEFDAALSEFRPGFS